MSWRKFRMVDISIISAISLSSDGGLLFTAGLLVSLMEPAFVIMVLLI